jgi:hypothetical protein
MMMNNKSWKIKEIPASLVCLWSDSNRNLQIKMMMNNKSWKIKEIPASLALLSSPMQHK